MPPKKDDDDRERPSWREIDQRRDGSRHRAKASPPVPKVQAESIRKQALAQAEALFKGKRARPEYQTDLKKLEAGHGSKKFPGLAKNFLEEYGLPEEWGALTRLLDYDDPSRGGGGAPGHGGPGFDSAAGWRSRGSKAACRSWP